MDQFRRITNSRGTPEKGSTGRAAGGRMRSQRMSGGPQPVLHEKNVMERRDNRKGEGGAQEDGPCNPYPADWLYGKEHHEEHGCDLRKSVRLSENAGPEIAQSGDCKQHGAGGQDGNIATEDQNGKLPRNLVQD